MSKKTAAPTVADMPKDEIIKQYALKDGDTGSPEVQIAPLTRRINDLTESLTRVAADPNRDLTEIEGIGKDLAQKIAELLETGSTEMLDQLRKEIPGGVLAMVVDEVLYARKVKRLKQSLALAMEIQQNLLPAGPPTVTGVDVAGFSDYCDETGGDYFDYPRTWEVPGGRVALTVGDVTGRLPLKGDELEGVDVGRGARPDRSL